MTDKEEPQKIYNRSTLEVAKTILDNETTYDTEEARVCFISLWATANQLYKEIAAICENPKIPKKIKEPLLPHYRGIPTAWNLPLEVRIPPNMRVGKLVGVGEKAAKDSGQAGPVIVQGYNDAETVAREQKDKATLQ